MQNNKKTKTKWRIETVAHTHTHTPMHQKAENCHHLESVSSFQSTLLYLRELQTVEKENTKCNPMNES